MTVSKTQEHQRSCSRSREKLLQDSATLSVSSSSLLAVSSDEANNHLLLFTTLTCYHTPRFRLYNPPTRRRMFCIFFSPALRIMSIPLGRFSRGLIFVTTFVFCQLFFFVFCTHTRDIPMLIPPRFGTLFVLVRNPGGLHCDRSAFLHFIFFKGDWTKSTCVFSLLEI